MSFLALNLYLKWDSGVTLQSALFSVSFLLCADAGGAGGQRTKGAGTVPWRFSRRFQEDAGLSQNQSALLGSRCAAEELLSEEFPHPVRNLRLAIYFLFKGEKK